MSNGYVFKVLLYLDIFVGGLIFRDADITISSMTGMELRKPAPRRWARILGWILDHIQKGHCESAIIHDRERAQAVIDFLTEK